MFYTFYTGKTSLKADPKKVEEVATWGFRVSGRGNVFVYAETKFGHLVLNALRYLASIATEGKMEVICESGASIESEEDPPRKYVVRPGEVKEYVAEIHWKEVCK